MNCDHVETGRIEPPYHFGLVPFQYPRAFARTIRNAICLSKYRLNACLIVVKISRIGASWGVLSFVSPSPKHPSGEGGLSLFHEGPLSRGMINRLPPWWRIWREPACGKVSDLGRGGTTNRWHVFASTLQGSDRSGTRRSGLTGSFLKYC